MNPFKKATELDKDILACYIKPGDFVIDVTCGNGNDTLFMADLVGPKGRVFAFDVQDIAIKKTKNVLIKAGMLDRVKLVKDDHSEMEKYVNCKIKAVVFNLGYLPGGDKSIVTVPETTIKAIKSSLSLLSVGGIITSVIYSGHKTGLRESHILEKYIETLDQRKYTAMKICPVNQVNNPPYLITIKKRKEDDN